MKAAYQQLQGILLMAIAIYALLHILLTVACLLAWIAFKDYCAAVTDAVAQQDCCLGVCVEDF